MCHSFRYGLSPLEMSSFGLKDNYRMSETLFFPRWEVETSVEEAVRAATQPQHNAEPKNPPGGHLAGPWDNPDPQP